MQHLERYDVDAQIEYAQAMFENDTLAVEKAIMEMTERLTHDYLNYQQSAASHNGLPWTQVIALARPACGWVPETAIKPDARASFEEIRVKLYPFFKVEEAQFMIEYMIRAQMGNAHLPG